MTVRGGELRSGRDTFVRLGTLLFAACFAVATGCASAPSQLRMEVSVNPVPEPETRTRAGGHDKICTLSSCASGAGIELRAELIRWDVEYRVVAKTETDATTRTLSCTLFKADVQCDEGIEVSRDHWVMGIRLALVREEPIRSTSLRVTANGRTILDSDLHLEWARYYPNGPSCPPSCLQGYVVAAD